MKKKFMFVVGVLALTGVSANATISVGPITTSPDGSGGTLWDYPITFNNSSISSTQPASFNLNDFGALKTTGSLPTGFTFSPGVAFTLDNSQNVGPSFGLPGFQPNNAGVKDVVITFTANNNMGAGLQTFNLILDTALSGTGGLANFFSQDIVSTGTLAGTPNAAQQNIRTPASVPTTVPDGGATVILLGAALSGLGLLRRKLG
jgi:VPDSG-CTERM motif